jgi:hypothetical protein
MTKAKAVLLAAVLFSMMGVGCGQKKDDTAPVGDARSGDVRVAGGPVNIPQGQSSGKAEAFVSNQNMSNDARSFVSSFIDPVNVGEVNPSTGVKVSGRIQYDGNGRILGQSFIDIIITDSHVGTTPNGVVNPLRVMVPASSVQSTGGTGVQVTFSDSFGAILVSGSWNGGTFSGTITFQNVRNHTGGAGGSSGTLGTFQIPVCSFFVCGG